MCLDYKIQRQSTKNHHRPFFTIAPFSPVLRLLSSLYLKLEKKFPLPLLEVQILNFFPFLSAMPVLSGKSAARSKVVVTLPPLAPGRFYAGVKKKPGPKRQKLSKSLRKPPPPVGSTRRSYTINYKLRVLSYWFTPSIPIGPTRKREPTRLEVADRFKIPASNLSRWKKDEIAGRYSEQESSQRQVTGGGRVRKWAIMERALYERFRQRRGEGKIIRRSWFRRVSKELFTECYPDQAPNLFRFSNGWFQGFLSWHQITLRCVTNKASQLPSDYTNAIINWMRYNRRNSQLRPDNDLGLGDHPADVGRYRLQNICNMDQTPLPFEYLDGKTYNQAGDSTIWVQQSQSGWDKRQATVQLTVFADGISRVQPLIFFRGKGIGVAVLAEMKLYDPRVIVKFNPKAYANGENLLQWLDEQVVPVLDNQPTLMVVDLFGAHKTDDVLDTMQANDITVSIIPGGCTGLIQPLDVSINRPFKDILKVFTYYL
jgi:hypothetical protein